MVKPKNALRIAGREAPAPPTPVTPDLLTPPNHSSFYTSPSFLSLQEEWYCILKDNDFLDIEYTFDDGNSSRFTTNWKPVNSAKPVELGWFNDRQEYYRLAGQYYWEHLIEFNKLERSVLFDHCQGISYRQIAKKNKLNPNKIYSIVRFFSDQLKEMVNCSSQEAI